MAEETKTAVRLSKAAKEFNIGVQTVIEFLGKKGHEIDSNPNSKLTAEQYALLAKEYQSDKAVRQEAENIDLGLGKKKAPITVEDVKNASPEAEPTAEPEDEELRIKKVSLEGPAKKAKTTKAKAEPKADAPAEAAEKPAKKTSRKAAAEPVAEPVAEAAPAAEAEEAETPEETAKT
ncbi:MAG: translation initiation factor IF-2, partial [Bacteroidales bacterium]|nr:translation initiation factor IF-2 [Bacteroidales bacterium]